MFKSFAIALTAISLFVGTACSAAARNVFTATQKNNIGNEFSCASQGCGNYGRVIAAGIGPRDNWRGS
jgi:hypothetical protein